MPPLEGALVESSWPICSPEGADLEEVRHFFFILAGSSSFVLEFNRMGFGSLELLLTGRSDLSVNLKQNKPTRVIISVE